MILVWLVQYQDIRLMKHLLFLSVVLLAVLPSLLSAQLPDFSDSAKRVFPDSLEHVSYTQLHFGSCGMFLVPIGDGSITFRDSATFAEHIESRKFIGNCRDVEVPDVDFRNNVVVGFNLFVDCNAMVLVSALKDTLRGEYMVAVDVHDGMCRGMTSRNYWLVIPVDDPSAKVDFVETQFEWDPID